MRRNRHRAVFWVLFLGLAASSGSPGSASVGVPTPGEPRVSIGDLHYHAAAVAYRHGNEEARAEFFISVPYREIRFVPVEDHFEARLRITAELTEKGGKRVAYQQREARVGATDVLATADSLLDEIYTLGLAAPRGRYRFKVMVEDLNEAKRGLVYQFKNKKRQGDVHGDIDMGDWLYKNPALSGIEFAWGIGEPSSESPFAKGPYEVFPHPSAYYGHFQDVISAYYEIYDAPSPPEGRAYRVRTMILGATADTLMEAVDSLKAADGSAWPHVVSADIASLPSGHYRFRLDLLRADEIPIATTQNEFDILWDVDSWRSDAVDYFEIAAATLMTAEEALQFRQVSRGDKERALNDLWRSIDPTPDTARNELKESFLQRLAYANAHFTIYEKGMFTDRGRTWIRYGEPDDIRVERMPVSEKSLGYVIQGQIPEMSKELLSRSDAAVVDTRPFEIWTYTLRGHEIVPRRAMNEVNSSMKFVFVDEQGYGEYVLRYSSVTGVR